ACLSRNALGQCQDRIDKYVAAPNQGWRSKMDWKGQTFFTPRLSFVSDGHVQSDHRYMQDLYFQSYNEAYAPTQPNLFATTKGHIHLDGQAFYLGVGSSW